MLRPLSTEELREILPDLIDASIYSIASLGRELGDKDFIRDFLRPVEKPRKDSLGVDALIKIEQLLKLMPGRLFYRDGLQHPTEANFTIRVAGRIGAGAEIHMDVEQAPEDGLFEIESTIPIPANALAFEVEGDSMWPRYDPGDVVICGRQGTNVDEIVNWEAAVLTADGRRFLKRVRRGSRKGLFDLESHNAGPIRDAQLKWASEIAQVIRAGQWKRLDHAGRRKALAKAAR